MNRTILYLILLALLLSGCGNATGEGAAQATVEPTRPAITEEPTAAPDTAEPRVVKLVTHDSFNASEAVLARFEEEHNAEVQIVPLGDAGAMVNQSILSKNNPLGDLLFGVDNTFLTRALDADLFEPYESPALAAVPPSFVLDEQHRVTPIDYGDVCLNYDIAYFEAKGIPAPVALEDLTRPEYAGLTVVENPASSSPGLAFLLATVGHFGDEGWQAYWSGLRDNDVLVTSGWSEAYFDHFTAGGGEGDRPIVVSYASSPPFTEGATASVVGDESCFRQIEFAGVLRNAQNPELARALLDFMLSAEFQNDVPEQMYVFPVIEGATLPDSFVQFAQIPENPATVAPETIEAQRDTLIEQWTQIVLR